MIEYCRASEGKETELPTAVDRSEELTNKYVITCLSSVTKSQFTHTHTHTQRWNIHLWATDYSVFFNFITGHIMNKLLQFLYETFLGLRLCAI